MLDKFIKLQPHHKPTCYVFQPYKGMWENFPASVRFPCLMTKHGCVQPGLVVGFDSPVCTLQRLHDKVNK